MKKPKFLSPLLLLFLSIFSFPNILIGDQLSDLEKLKVNRSIIRNFEYIGGSGLTQTYPSKLDHNGPSTGDSTLFAGLLCASGDNAACDSVKRAQGPDGRWYRSPYQLHDPAKAEGENAKTASFSRDAGFGVLLYLLKTHDLAAATRWKNYTEQLANEYKSKSEEEIAELVISAYFAQVAEMANQGVCAAESIELVALTLEGIWKRILGKEDTTAFQHRWIEFLDRVVLSAPEQYFRWQVMEVEDAIEVANNKIIGVIENNGNGGWYRPIVDAFDRLFLNSPVLSCQTPGTTGQFINQLSDSFDVRFCPDHGYLNFNFCSMTPDWAWIYKRVYNHIGAVLPSISGNDLFSNVDLDAQAQFSRNVIFDDKLNDFYDYHMQALKVYILKLVGPTEAEQSYINSVTSALMQRFPKNAFYRQLAYGFNDPDGPSGPLATALQRLNWYECSTAADGPDWNSIPFQIEWRFEQNMAGNYDFRKNPMASDCIFMSNMILDEAYGNESYRYKIASDYLAAWIKQAHGEGLTADLEGSDIPYASKVYALNYLEQHSFSGSDPQHFLGWLRYTQQFQLSRNIWTYKWSTSSGLLSRYASVDKQTLQSIYNTFKTLHGFPPKYNDSNFLDIIDRVANGMDIQQAVSAENDVNVNITETIYVNYGSPIVITLPQKDLDGDLLTYSSAYTFYWPPTYADWIAKFSHLPPCSANDTTCNDLRKPQCELYSEAYNFPDCNYYFTPSEKTLGALHGTATYNMNNKTINYSTSTTKVHNYDAFAFDINDHLGATRRIQFIIRIHSSAASVKNIYLSILNREPTPEESAEALSFLNGGGSIAGLEALVSQKLGESPEDDMPPADPEEENVRAQTEAKDAQSQSLASSMYAEFMNIYNSIQQQFASAWSGIVAWAESTLGIVPNAIPITPSHESLEAAEAYHAKLIEFSEKLAPFKNQIPQVLYDGETAIFGYGMAWDGNGSQVSETTGTEKMIKYSINSKDWWGASAYAFHQPMDLTGKDKLKFKAKSSQPVAAKVFLVTLDPSNESEYVDISLSESMQEFEIDLSQANFDLSKADAIAIAVSSETPESYEILVDEIRAEISSQSIQAILYNGEEASFVGPVSWDGNGSSVTEVTDGSEMLKFSINNQDWWGATGYALRSDSTVNMETFSRLKFQAKSPGTLDIQVFLVDSNYNESTYVPLTVSSSLQSYSIDLSTFAKPGFSLASIQTLVISVSQSENATYYVSMDNLVIE